MYSLFDDPEEEKPVRVKSYRLTKNEAITIYLSEEPIRVIASLYGISRRTVDKIKNKETWKSLHNEEK